MAVPERAACPKCGKHYTESNGHCQNKTCTWLRCKCGTTWSTRTADYKVGGGHYHTPTEKETP